MLKLWLRCVQYCAVDPSGLGLNGKTIQSAGVGKPSGLNGEQTTAPRERFVLVVSAYVLVAACARQDCA